MFRSSHTSIAERARPLLTQGLDPTWQRLNGKVLDELLGELPGWLHTFDAGNQKQRDEAALRRLLTRFLNQVVRRSIEQARGLQAAYNEFNRRFNGASNPQEERSHIIDFVRELGADATRLRGDQAAFARWFGRDAVVDRYQRRHAACERKAATCLERLGTLSATLLSDAQQAGEDVAALWRRLELENLIKPLLVYNGDIRVRSQAFDCLVKALQVLPPEQQENSVSDSTLQYIFRASLERRQDVWIQARALALLASLSPESLSVAIEKRLSQPGDQDDLFVRRRAVLLLGEHLHRDPRLLPLLALALDDPSPYVRQGLCLSLAQVPPDWLQHHYPSLLGDEPSPQVRAQALLAACTLFTRRELRPLLAEQLQRCLQTEQDDFVLRVALQVVDDIHRNLVGHNDTTAAADWRDRQLPALAALHRNADSLGVRRRAAQTRERIWCQADPEARQLIEVVAGRLTVQARGKRRRLSIPAGEPAQRDLLGRVLAVHTQQDFGCDVQSGRRHSRVTRDHVFGFRWWRLLHELRRPSPDKRQAFSHTVGRIFSGDLRAPSACMAEMARTKVPGEPLLMDDEQGWRPYLPLVDDVISALDPLIDVRPVRFYTSEGITTLTPPRSLARRLRAQLSLTGRFAHYARLRNWEPDDQDPPDRYAVALRGLGIELAFEPHPSRDDRYAGTDPAVQRFFPVMGLSLGEWGQRLQDYFFSVYENSLTELIIFITAASGLFFGRHVWINRLIRRTRDRIPLVIGGWGTRGKSGTERLKAALFNALGYNLVSKTTGCEAMFLHGYGYGQLREMFLFRPYDKATIWEQADVLRLADKLGVEVFLWECMGLTPSYIRILQQQWMRDDYATITNTYPDHEDLQGPAGINIPEVMTEFIPSGSRLITSEEQMLPLLRDAAQRVDTACDSVGWLEAGLLTPDVLARFPYQEHPYNIALVLALAQQLGIEADYALKEMADRVVEDLGVLKTYPTAPVLGRQLSFVNGMSANERLGALGNWHRMGFADHDPRREPGSWISTVVNNRADRVARSRVFAAMLVADISADRHFLIGSNLPGLMGYIDEAWKAEMAGFTLWPTQPEGKEVPTPAAVFTRAARRLRIPVDESELNEFLRVMTGGLCIDWQDRDAVENQLQQTEHPWTGDILQHLDRRAEQHSRCQQFLARLDLATASQSSQFDREAADLLWQWFSDKLVVLEDPHLSGDRIVEEIARHTPPGLLNRIMGMQNIKGTGLDFVYRWQAWEQCHKACMLLQDFDQELAAQGLQRLAAFQDYGLLSERHVLDLIAEVRQSPNAQSEYFQAELTLIESNLQRQLKQIRQKQEGQEGGGLMTRIYSVVEAFLDAGDAVKRRKLANRIYRDLADERISHARAALELQELNNRQKGGWLLRQANALKNRVNALSAGSGTDS